jgi:oxygen-independent coproporphyrinogen-3 oxidase
VLAELRLRGDAYAGELQSIYFGGGTPSLWRADCLAKAISAVKARYGEPREVTIEVNPTDCTADQLAAWRDAGITRISIGVQSFEPQTLVTLGRDHRFGDGRAALDRVLAAGFEVSADFILGVPGSEQLELDLRPNHLSIYELTIEERTAFGQRVRDGRMVPLPDDTLAELYTQTHERLTGEGYEHYEISSYARPGHRAVHNSLYWRGVPYLGLGVGAASLAVDGNGAGTRQTNPRRASDYLAAPGTPAEQLAVSARDMAIDRAWLALRVVDGITEEALAPARGVADWLVSESLAQRREDRICPTLRGFLLADRIAARIVQTWPREGEQ